MKNGSLTAAQEADLEINTLVLHRFNGDEVFGIRSATMEAFEEDGAIELFLYVNTKVKPIQTLADTAELEAEPNAEVYIPFKRLDVAKLVGSRHSVPAAYDAEKEDYVACIYYCDHQDLDKNVVRILEQQGNKFLVHWTGKTGDMAYYDGSKPDAKVEIKAWFTFKGMKRWLAKAAKLESPNTKQKPKR